VCEPSVPAPRQPRLLDRVREALRARHSSRRTEKSYVAGFAGTSYFTESATRRGWDLSRFLSSLAQQDHVPASTQNYAISALLFLYRQVLQVEMPWLVQRGPCQAQQTASVVLTREVVRAVIQELQGPPRLMAILLYGVGLRLLECARIRVKDVDFATNQVVVRAGKGRPRPRDDAARRRENRSRPGMSRWSRGSTRPISGTAPAGWSSPWALARKYPNAGREWAWQWMFPATRIYVDRETGQRRRHHLH